MLESKIKRRGSFYITLCISILFAFIMMTGPSKASVRKNNPKKSPAKQKVTKTVKTTSAKPQKSEKAVIKSTPNKSQKATLSKNQIRSTSKNKKEALISKAKKKKQNRNSKALASPKISSKKETRAKISAEMVAERLMAAGRKKRKTETFCTWNRDLEMPRYTADPNTANDPSEMPFGETLTKYMGVPYRTGGDDLDGMDCSGFASRFFNEEFGIQLPHNSQAISELDILEPLSSEDNYRPSDLLFFGRGKNRITHLGIYLADGKFIHSASSGGVIISSLDDAYWKTHLVTSKRVKTLDSQISTLESGPQRLGFNRGEDNTSFAEAHGYLNLIPHTLNAGVGTFQHTSISSSKGIPLAQAFNTPRYAADGTQWLRGWRAHLNLTPADWLRVTPSVSWIDGSDLDPTFDADAPVYGLEAAVSHRNIPWSMGISAHSASFKDPMASTSGLPVKNQQTDLAFGFNYQPAQTVALSVGGNYQPDNQKSSVGGSSSASSDQHAMYFRVSVDF